ncbi:MAG: hypothetical protein R3F49_05990 [Planctomycetota bacterium]
MNARLARMEAQLATIQARVEAPPKVEGGIGCFGFVLFLILFSRIDDVLELVRRLSS